MKKIYYMLCMLAVFGLAACSNEQDDLFDDSSANRIDAATNETNLILVGAEKGWLMEYFLDGNLTYGGYNTLVKFNEDGTVDAASEMFSSDKVARSLYTISQSAGLVVSIDTYNEVFSAFSDPLNIFRIGETGAGMGGDNDFLVISATNEEVVLKGKKSGLLVSLTPMEQEWTSFLDGIKATKSEMFAPAYAIKLGEQTLKVSPFYNTLSITYMVGEEARTISVPYITDEGSYIFHEPIEILGHTISGFNYLEASSSFVAIDDAAITMVQVIPPLNEQFLKGDWFIAYSDLGPFGQTNLNKAKINGFDAMGFTLEYAFMGSMLYGTFGFNLSSSGYKGLLTYNYALAGEDQVTLQFAMAGEGNGVYFHNNGCHYMLIPFGYNSPVTFTLTTDNVKEPTYILLTDNSNPDNWMKLHKEQIVFPFDR